MSRTSERPGRLRRLALPAAALLVVGAIGRCFLRRRPAMEPVVADLRMPVLYLPMSLRSERVLRVVRSLPAPPLPTPSGVVVESRTIATDAGDQLRVVTYERPDRAHPGGALLWIHGGGMVLGTPEQGHPLCGRWADELGILVVSVDYRLAPEHPFPDGLEDCYAALGWLHHEAAALGVDTERVAVGGDSAGGGLAAALSQMARDRGGPGICFQLLEYPMLDDRTVLRSDHGGTGAFVWTPASNRFAWSAYLGRPPAAGEAPLYAAPARTEDLTGLPPAWVGVGELDLFHAEDVRYADRLRSSGVACDLHVEPGMYHGADALRAKAPTSMRFRDLMTAALRAGLDVDGAVVSA
ncbi:MAG TPA: alpha/beta hydrolase [Acidimicrobiales bacterium]